MKLRFMVLALAAVAALAIAAFAQTEKQSHDHGAHGAMATKAPSDDHISAADLKQRLDTGDKVILIDARHDVGNQILKGAIHVPSDKLEDWAKTADKTATIVTYCTCPHDEAADAEMQKLREMGFKNAYSLSGGMEAAKMVGIEVVAPAEK